MVNPKQQACHYPFKKLCGAAVAFKLVQVLYEVFGLEVSEADCFIENAGFATVGDVMDLQGEKSRILGKNWGWKMLKPYHEYRNESTDFAKQVNDGCDQVP